MNKIYQVIWSKTKHMYIVVSELAHHDGKAKTTVHKGGTAFAKATAALVLAALLNAAPVYAEDKTVDIGNGGTATYTEKGNVVIGKDNTVPNDGAGKNVVTGTGNSAQHVDGTGNAQKFLPDDPKLVDDNNGNPTSVPTPGNTKGLDSAVISGNGASAEADGDTSIGKGANITNPLVPYYADENGNATRNPNAAAYFYQNGKLVKGTDGLKYATGATDANGNPVTSTDPYYKHTYETTVTILHPDGTIERKKLDPMTVINQDPSASPTSYNTTKDDEGNIITTKVKETETPTRNLADGYSYYSQSFYDPSTDSIAVGTNASVTGKDGVAVGHDAEAAANAAAVGNKASAEEGGAALGPAAAAGENAVAVGIGANAELNGVANGAASTAGENAVAMGDSSYAGDFSQAIGSGSQATVVSTAVGTGSQATLNSTAVGNGSKATGAGSAALGNNSSATADGGVALGNGSVADRGAENYGWDPVTKTQATAEDKGTDPVWYSNRGAVSVGVSDADGNPIESRQITNVAAGTNDGDAVNVAQLKSAVTAAETHYYSWNDQDDHQPNYKNEGATGNRALAAGIGAAAAGDGATSVGNYTNASGKTSIAIGGTALDADGNKKYEQVPKMVQKVDDNGQPVTDDEGNPVMVQATDDEGNLLTENKLDANGNPIPLNTEATGENAIAIGTHAKGWGQDSIAIGTDSQASQTDATAVGRKSNAWAPSASAFGAEAEAGSNATAVGKTSHAYSENATSVGADSNANYYATAVGQHANATSSYDTAVGQNSTASGSQSVAVGNSSMSSSYQATAVGDNAHAENSQATALGYSSMANGSYSTAVGQSANANNAYDTAVGNTAHANGSYSTAVGYSANSQSYSTTAVGYSATAYGAHSSALGEGSSSSGTYSTAVGYHATTSSPGGWYSSDSYATAVGSNSSASGQYATAVGYSAYTPSTNATAVGHGANASGSNATAVGYYLTASGTNSTAVGYQANASSEYATAVGHAYAPSGNSTAVGEQASAQGYNATSAGYKAYAYNSNSTAFGANSAATDSNNTAIGYYSYAGGYGNSVAVGYSASANASNAVAIGGARGSYNSQDTSYNTSASASYSVAIGSNAKASNTNAVAIGSNQNTSYNPSASGYNSVAIGSNAKAANSGAIAIGSSDSYYDSISATGQNSLAFGYSAKATDTNAIGIGSYANAYSQNAVRIGASNSTSYNAVNANSVGIGTNTNAWGTKSVRIGYADANYSSNGAGENSVSIGVNARAGGYNASDAIAMGTGSNAYGTDSIAMSSGASAAKYAVSVGKNADAWREDSIVFGFNSKSGAEHGIMGYDPLSANIGQDYTTPTWTSTNNAVSFGRAEERDADGNVTLTQITRQINNVAAGTLDTDVVNVAQLKSAIKSFEYNAGKWHDYDVNVPTEEIMSDTNYDNTGAQKGKRAMAAGFSAQANGDDSMALGHAVANGTESVAIGKGANVIGVRAVGFGANQSIGLSSMAFGQGNTAGKPADENGAYTLQYNGTDKKETVMADADMHEAYTDGGKTFKTEDKADQHLLVLRTKDNTPVVLASDGKLYNVSWDNDSNSYVQGDEATGLTTANLVTHAYGTDGATFVGAYSTAFGHGNTASGTASLAFGGEPISIKKDRIYTNTASGKNSVAFGAGTVASGQDTVAFGDGSTASNDEAVAFGQRTTASAARATAFGESSTASGQTATAFGYHTTASGTGATALGNKSQASGMYAMAWGGGDRHVKDAQGNELKDDQGNPVKLGPVASGTYSTAFGSGTQATAENATAFGELSNATGKNSTAFGKESTASGENTLAALGGTAEGANSTAIGVGATAKLDGSIALGDGAVANTAAGKVGYDALGTGYVSTDQSAAWKSTKNALSVGDVDNKVTRQITGLAAGSEDTDAVNVAQLKRVTTLAEQHTLVTVNQTKTEAPKDATTGKYTDEYDTENGNLNIRASTGENGQNTFNIKLNDQIGLGQKGEPGTPGKDGVDGKVTVTQKDGTTIIIGKDGEDGAPGLTIKGPKGEDGTDGKDAVAINGKDGIGTIGLAGKDGTKGTDGKDGISTTTIRTEYVHEPGVNGENGKDGKPGETRIIYKDPDNKDHTVATLEDGLKFTGNNSSTINHNKLNTTVNVVGEGTGSDLTNFKSAGGNIAVEANGKNDNESTLTIKLNKDVNLGNTGSLTVGGDTNNTNPVVIKHYNDEELKDTKGGDVSGGDYITGLDNRTWNIDNPTYVSGRAATEDELKQAGDQIIKNVTNTTENGGNGGFGLQDEKTGKVSQNLGTNISVIGDGNRIYENGTLKDVTDSNITTEVVGLGDGTHKAVKVALSDQINVGGNDGKDGKIGVNGKDGKDGNNGRDAVSISASDGLDGVNGKDGHIGMTSTRGIDGKDGAPGTDGKVVYADIQVRNGHNGVDGTDGKDGTDGMTRIVYEDNNKVIHEVATLDDGMKYGANIASAADWNNPVYNKLNTIVNVKGGADNTDGYKEIVKDGMTDAEKLAAVKTKYSGQNVLTTVEQDATTGTTTIKVLLDKDLQEDTINVGGNDGENGKDGKDGVDGRIGVQGANGKDGVTITARGKDGKDGAVGEIGLKGEDGKDGIGLNGKDGISMQGEAGKNGISIKGDPGEDGKPGKDGISIKGPQGDPGEPGNNGHIGITGKDGKDAVAINGTDGKGTIGLAGKDGKDGISTTIIRTEYVTKPGVDGEDGKDGVTRIIYKDPEGGEHDVATLDDGLKFTGNNSTTINHNKLDTTVHVVGEGTSSDLTTFQSAGGNIAVEANGGDDDQSKLTVKLNKDVNLGSDGSLTVGGNGTNNDSIVIKNQTVNLINKDGDYTQITQTGDYILGLDNRTWNVTNPTYVSGRAATEDELKQAGDQIIKNITNTTENGGNGGFGLADDKGGKVSQNLGTNIQVIGDGDRTYKDDGKGGKVIDKVENSNITTEVVNLEDGSKAVQVSLSDNVNLGKPAKDGKDGVDGSIGIHGKDGISGVGIDGKDGISMQGEAGKNGISIKGDPGKDGEAGISIQGPQGEPGKDGIDGHIGIRGKDGNDAVALDGKDGVGHIGLQGPAGTNGKDGTSAIDISVKNGTPGVDGKDGTTRIIYEDKGGTHEIATLDDGLKFTGNNSDTVNHNKLDTTVHIVGEGTDKDLSKFKSAGGNIAVEANGGSDNASTLTIKLNKDVNLGGDGSLTVGGDGNVTRHNEDGSTTVVKNDPVVIKNYNEGELKDNKGNDIEKGDYITGLDNRTWNIDDPTYVSGRAATEDELKQAGDQLNTKITNVENKITNITDADKGGGFGLADDTGKKVSQDLGTNIQVIGDGDRIYKDDGKGGKVIDKVENSNITTEVVDLPDGSKAVQVSLSDNVNLGGPGKNGKDGVDGSIGINGKDGKSGVGIDGKDGISMTGEAGKNGISIKGDPGKDGEPGKTLVGINGKDGEGHIGLTGKPGKDGKDATADITVHQGPVGVDGTDGKNGKDGMDRITYVDHNEVTHEVATLDDGLKFGANAASTNYTDNPVYNKLNSTVDIVGEGTKDESAYSGKNIKTFVKQDDGNTTITVKLDKDLQEDTINVGGKDGEPGKDGKDGVDGKIGVQGKNGKDGVTITAKGEDGKDGAVGDIGIKGEDGKDGIGLNGKDGISMQGEAGKNGISIKGDPGDDGQPGKDGISIKGPSGKDGDNGHIGISGKDGKDAVALDGKDGVGHIGLTGPAGKDGKNASADISVKNGSNGVDGTDGNNGKDGMDRITYVDHNEVTHEVATLDDGLNFTGNNTDTTNHHKLNTLVKVQGEGTGSDLSNFKSASGNIAVEADGKDTLTIKLNKDLGGLNSVTTNNAYIGGNTVINNNGITTNKVVVGNTTVTNNSITVNNGTNIDMGDNQIHNVKAGTAPTDAVNVSQLGESNTTMSNRINRLGDQIDRVGAHASAMAALHPLDFDPDEKLDFAAGFGNYKGEHAAAIGAFYRPNEDTMFSLGGSVGGGDNMVNVGVSFKLGQHNHVSVSRVALAKEVLELRKELENVKSYLADQAAGNTLDLSKIQLFPDTPENHWAYDYVATMAGNGVLEGYPDGYFKGNRNMTRYEMAAVLYRMMQNGAKLSARALTEFAPELDRIRVDTITKDGRGVPHIQRVRTVKGRE